jgi:conserved oligomeric Golgi complex subunit 6
MTIASLNDKCEEMRGHVTAAHLETAPVLEEASEFMSRKEQVEKKQQLLQAFNSHFIISEDDIATLTSAMEPVNDHFFSILARAKKLQGDCEILLGIENQSVGLEIIDQVTKALNGAFQKLYRWNRSELKSLNLENPQISSTIRKALRVLAERPSLFQSCLDHFAEARDHTLSDAFFTALTGRLVSGEEDKSIKPIELAAPDPLRYIGDMLAWTHSATVSEREALEVLFMSDGDGIANDIQVRRGSEPWNQYSEEGVIFDRLKALNDLTDRDIAGVAKVLRQRIEQVIQSHEDTITAYKIANLLKFYRITFSKLLSRESTLLETLANLEESALRQFRVLMRDHISGLQGELHQAPVDLGLPAFLQDGLKQLTAIMRTYETSLISVESRDEIFEPILEESFNPYMVACENMAASLNMPRKAIFSINCLLVAQATLLPFNFTSDQVEKIEASIREYSTTLVESQHTFFIRNSGVYPLLQALRSPPTDVRRIASMDELQPQALIDSSQTLDNFLPSALMDAMDNLKELQSSKLIRKITEEAADKFCKDFETVEENIVAADEAAQSLDPVSDEVKSLRALFPRTSGELRVLLT